MRIHFYIRFASKFGENLYLSFKKTPAGLKDIVPMRYLSEEYWEVEINIDNPHEPLQYKYILKNRQGEQTGENGYNRIIDFLNIKDKNTLKFYDVWNDGGDPRNAFYTAPFKNILLPATKYAEIDEIINTTHTFKIKAPLIQNNQTVCLLGSAEKLNCWNTAEPLLMQKDGDWWKVSVSLTSDVFPVAYKYGIFDTQEKKFIDYETGSNRICYQSSIDEGLVTLHDGFIQYDNKSWKGAGVSLPVFSIRTRNGLGTGEFNDLKMLADWASEAGLKLIQLLPVNDTSATFTWTDSYPYAAISAFALHPIYINIEKVAGKKYKDIATGLAAKQQELNALPQLDYEVVLLLKLSLLNDIFKEDAARYINDEGFLQFIGQNEKWLKPYAIFCYLRDTYKTPDSSKWGKNSIYKEEEIEKFFQSQSGAYEIVHFYCWLQYHLHLQLHDAVNYAHSKGVVLKGDIPIGVYRFSVDTWTAPELYNMNQQAGAPPDDFAIYGQNWGFPTYNWQEMQHNGFAWWKERFEQMSRYFDAFRIDHILGFFRIWSIPLHAVQGVMGKFEPCLPLKREEFGEKGIWFDKDRFCNPYITDAILHKVFGDRAEKIKGKFLQKSGPETYALLPEFNMQRKVRSWFLSKKKPADADKEILNGLYELTSNVILFEQETSAEPVFHFRIAMNQTSSFQFLREEMKERLWNLYNDYFYTRQDELWRKEAMKKLPGLKEATQMLVCGEDLGMVPACVPDVMQQLGLLSLEIQRMPKNPGLEFFNPADAPYLSVVTPSTHDMSTIRGWWQEDSEMTQRFYNTILKQEGTAPQDCEPRISKAIILQHLFSPAMWSIFQIQDLLGMSEELRYPDIMGERINIPENPHHYWRYRMHISLEELMKEKNFNLKLKKYVSDSGR